LITETAQIPRSAGRRRVAVALAVGVTVAVALAAALLALGGRAVHAAAGPPRPRGAPAGVLDTTAKFLLAVALILVLTHGLGALLRRLGQPPVVGEILAGIALGPSLLATQAPGLWHALFPPAVLGGVDLVAQLGLVVFVFLIGWEIDLGQLRRVGHAVATVSLASLAVPFLSGLGLAFALYGSYRGGHVGFPAFAMFVGLALAITALPVLARILDDRDLVHTRVGGLALASAVIEDAAAWTLLAVALAFASVTGAVSPWLIILLAAAFATAMMLGVRPVLARLVRAAETRGGAELTLLPLVLIGAFGAAVATQAIGVHAIFGAFLFGLVMPRGTRAGEVITTRIRSFTTAVLLPLFFAATGMHVAIGSLGGHLSGWLAPLAIFAVAVLTKLVGAGLAARFAGLPPREAYAVGVLMNCRGLTEIVIASVGLQLAIIDTRLFTMLVLMALGTTALTTPLLSLRRAK
jgi:Kef-type K+ transport system membrane component KefB